MSAKSMACLKKRRAKAVLMLTLTLTLKPLRKPASRVSSSTRPPASLAKQSIWHHAALFKVFVSAAVNRVAGSAVQITGALGISEDWPLSMIRRTFRPFRICDGASEVHRAAIAKRVFHRGPLRLNWPRRDNTFQFGHNCDLGVSAP